MKSRRPITQIKEAFRRRATDDVSSLATCPDYRLVRLDNSKEAFGRHLNCLLVILLFFFWSGLA